MSELVAGCRFIPAWHVHPGAEWVIAACVFALLVVVIGWLTSPPDPWDGFSG